jgi:hypothetical protein
MNKELIFVLGICVMISILSPLVSYAYFEGRLNSTFESYNLNISNAEQENEKLKQEIINLTQVEENLMQNEDNAYLTKPYLVTNLGWYLHNSTDAISSSKNTFTIYGTVLNVGAANAEDCSLIIHFYSNRVLLQTSEVYIGEIKYWSTTSVSRTIQCSLADSVTGIEVTAEWS